MIRRKVATKSRVAEKKAPRKTNLLDDAHQAIEQKAYELFERRGYQHGNDWADWFEAERAFRRR